MTNERNDCGWVEERLVDHLDGALGVEDTRALVDHLAGCPACAAAAADYAAIRAAYRDLPEEEPSPEVSEQVLAWARAEGLHPERFGREPAAWERPFGRLVGLAAAVLLVMALWSGLLDDLLGPGASDDSPEAQFVYWVERAEEAADRGDRKAAIEAYQSALGDLPPDTHPGVPRALHRLAELRLGGGEPAAALSAVDQLIDGFPGYDQRAAALFLEGRIHTRLGDRDAAAEAYGACLALDPELAVTLWERAGGSPAELSALGYSEGSEDLVLPEPDLDELRALGYQ